MLREKLLQTFDFEIFELNQHRFATMNCSARTPDFAALSALLIDDIDRLFAVDEMLQVIALGDDHVIVPVAFLDGGLMAFGSPATPTTSFFPSAWMTTLSDRVAREFRGLFLHTKCLNKFCPCLHVGLITADDEIFRFQNFAAILNAGIGEALVVVGNELELAMHFEITGLAAFPDEKCVFFADFAFGGLAGDCAVFDRPKFGQPSQPVRSLPLNILLNPASSPACW